MITKNTFKALLQHLGFQQDDNVYITIINGYEIKVDFKEERIHYPKGIETNRDTTLNLSQNENFVVFECIYQLLKSGYKPEHIILERGMPGGHGDTGGYCDILVQDNDKEAYLLIECKTTDSKNSEFEKAWKYMQQNGGQLFNYYNSFRQAKYICLYASDFFPADQNNIARLEQTYKLISMTDNEAYLDSDASLKSYKSVQEANAGKQEYFNVWTQTYQQDYTTYNLFESEPFKIGTRPYNITDLKIVDGFTIQKKYHEFATILRRHNVSGRENAFDKLVNLFLVKILDETKNTDNLQVYWKGAASDDYYSLQDRLQRLYKESMEQYLKENISYIEENTIKEAFHLFKNEKDATKEKILEYFRVLKFYTNNDFAFLDVHNKELFVQNAVILKEIVQMLQDIRLKTDGEQHQFLGDLFEGFLDQGVKQSEGQFFTPMPIVKFLVSSLPLENMIKKSERIPKAVDYACGAGHFLTEYAAQIKPFVLQYKGDNLADYYAQIYGIEKEYRLSKVAKVSAFMYGQEGIQIFYNDALSQKVSIEDNSFSVLIANPPYSVKGFLETLTEGEREAFELFNKDINIDTFNSIETFFIERAKQLLCAEGIAAIVLPASVLTNGNIYIKCREILLKHFDIVAIAEMGSGTFGKTGTNTATLFLRRKNENPSHAVHYSNRVAKWFSGDDNLETIFQDEHLLQAYCAHCGFNFIAYKDFLRGKETSLFTDNELFKEYRKEFDNSTEVKNLHKKTSFKELADAEQQAQLQTLFAKTVKAIESEKLYYYLLAQENPQPVLIVKSPSDNKAMKDFLGYEWSAAKGNEGIKYLGVQSEGEGIGKNQDILKIVTPLFTPMALHNDTSKINSFIRANFKGETIVIPEELKTFVSYIPLTDMLDFSRTTFDKALQTSVKRKVEVISKYPLRTIAEIIPTIESGKRPSGGVGNYKEGAYSLGGEHIGKDNGRLDLKDIKYVPLSYFRETKKGVIAENDILICKDGALTGKVAIVRNELQGIDAMINEHIFLLRCNDINTQKYVFNFLYSEAGQELLKLNITGAAQGGLNSTNLKNIKIPLPPIPIQQQIVAECEAIDKEYENSRMSIEEYRGKIAQIFHDLSVLEKTNGGGGKTL